MLQNDPPPQTLVRFLKPVRPAVRYATAHLIGPVGKHTVDKPDDLFDVRYKGARMVVRRDEIEEA